MLRIQTLVRNRPAILVSNIHREVWLVPADLTFINYITAVRWSTIKAWMLIMESDFGANDITSQPRVISHIRAQHEAGFLHPHLHHVLFMFSSSARSAEGCTMRTRTCQMWRKSQTSGASAWRTNLPAIHTTVNLFSIWRGKVLSLCLYC